MCALLPHGQIQTQLHTKHKCTNTDQPERYKRYRHRYKPNKYWPARWIHVISRLTDVLIPHSRPSCVFSGRHSKFVNQTYVRPIGTKFKTLLSQICLAYIYFTFTCCRDWRNMIVEAFVTLNPVPGAVVTSILVQWHQSVTANNWKQAVVRERSHSGWGQPSFAMHEHEKSKNGRKLVWEQGCTVYIAWHLNTFVKDKSEWRMNARNLKHWDKGYF